MSISTKILQYRYYGCHVGNPTVQDFEADKNYPKPDTYFDRSKINDKKYNDNYKVSPYWKYNLIVGTPNITFDGDFSSMDISKDIKTSEDVKNLLTTGTIFKYLTPQIRKLGIQTLPGVKFKVNKGDGYITIGYSGLYEIDLGDNLTIEDLEFDPMSIDMIGEVSGGYLIIDVLYEEGRDKGGKSA